MSQVYSTEPSTSARIVLRTTAGPIDVRLWTKECPSATRTFLRLCRDGYYDDCLFHRIEDGFVIQTGYYRRREEVADGAKGRRGKVVVRSIEEEKSISEYLSQVEDWSSGGRDRDPKLELNPRIRFNRRGQLALAIPLSSLSEATPAQRHQFFITLDELPHLNDQHLIFGTVTGPTTFNALRIGRTETNEEGGEGEEGGGRPVDWEDGPRILGTPVAEHPFEDLTTEIPGDDRLPWRREEDKAREAVEGDDGAETTKRKRMLQRL